MNSTPASCFRLKPSLIVSLLALLPAAAGAQSLLSHYTLDGTENDGGSVNVDGTLSGTAAFTSSGAGVGNFDKALSVGPAAGYLGAATANNAAFGLDAITVAMWVKVDAGASNDRLVSNLTTSSGFDVSLYGYSAGSGAEDPDTFRLTFNFNGTSGAAENTHESYVSGKWLFLAVTYDSSTSTISYFSGDEDSEVGFNGINTNKSGSIAASSSALRIGSTPASGADRTPTALLNDVRIYGGALSVEQLEAIRSSAFSAIPEPSSYGAIIGGLALAGALSRRRGVRRQAV